MEREEIRKYILDSSVAVKWFVDEKGSDKARVLKDNFTGGILDIIAPALLKYEVANALRWHPTVRMEQTELSSVLRAIDQYQFLLDPPESAWNKAIELSYSSGISLYDAIYLALAHTLKSKLITADEKLIDAVPPSLHEEIVSLSTLSPE